MLKYCLSSFYCAALNAIHCSVVMRILVKRCVSRFHVHVTGTIEEFVINTNY